jgi:hypothetical protein
MNTQTFAEKEAGMRLSVGIVLVCSTQAWAAESTRSIDFKWKADPSLAFAIENLAGDMRVLPATDGAVTVTAVVHAESDPLASAVKIEEVTGPKGVPTLRVRYPLDQSRSFRYPLMKSDSSWVGKLLGWFGSSTSYNGDRVSVSRDTGTLLYADVEVHVPPGLQVTFRNVVGHLSGQDVDGRLRFDISNGGITLDRVKGDTHADTGSGDVQARGGSGSLDCNTGSGTCNISGFEGERISIDTGSGTARVETSKARKIHADTGSGGVRLTGVDVEEVDGDTGSGGVELEVTGHRLRKVKADTGSGSVVLRIDPEAGFHMKASVASGSIHCDFADARVLKSDNEIVGCDRGDGAVQIAVDTGSGSVTVAPVHR